MTGGDHKDAGAWRAGDGFEYARICEPQGDVDLIGGGADAWLDQMGLDLREAIDQIEQLIELERLVTAVESAAELVRRAASAAP